MEEEQPTLSKNERAVVSPELSDRMNSATRSIEAKMREPGSEASGGVAQMGMMAELALLGKENMTKRLGIMFKDAKVVLSVIPGLSHLSKLRSGATTVEKAVVTAAGTGRTVSHAQKELNMAKKAWEAAERSATKSVGNAERAAAAAEKYKAYRKAMGALTRAEQASAAGVKAAKVELAGVAVNKNEKWFAKMYRRYAGKVTDSDYAVWWKDVQDRAKVIKGGMTEAQMMERVATGRMPARNAAEKVGRGAKHFAGHMILHNLGPIIDPSPDVPGPVVLASFGAELFGQFWAGFIPGIWQYTHNRIADIKLTVETTKKAKDIVFKHWGDKRAKLKDPQVARAAAAFLPPQPVAA